MTYESLIRTEKRSPFQAEIADQDVWGQKERCKAVNAENVFVFHRKRSEALGCSREAISGRAKGVAQPQSGIGMAALGTDSRPCSAVH